MLLNDGCILGFVKHFVLFFSYCFLVVWWVQSMLRCVVGSDKLLVYLDFR